MNDVRATWCNDGDGAVETESNTSTLTREIPRYHVVLLDDDDHTYEYVVEMLGAVFGFSKEKAYLHACEVDANQRTIVITTSKEHAELKQEQVHSYGPDPRIANCKGSMTAILEPA